MQFYAHYDNTTGKILGFYVDAIHGENIPAPNIPITEEAWRDALDNQGRRKVSLENLTIVEMLPPVPNREECLRAIRVMRDRLLSACDWTQISDCPMTNDKRVAWQIYRRMLRDFPETCNPYNPAWPDEPTK